MLRALRRSGQKVASYRNERHLQQDESMSNHIDRDVINALIAGHFADPFPCSACTVLTPGWKCAHYYPMPPTCGLLNRKPDAKSASSNVSTRVVSSAASCRGVKTLFAISWPSRHGQQNLIDDPYRFGPLLQDLDVWLLSEGTHLRPYETLGAHAATMDGVTGTRSRCGRRTPAAYRWWGSLTTGMAVATRCDSAKSPGSGSCSFPARTMASCINSN